MKKSLLNIKHFVDSNVRQRIDRASNNNVSELFGEDLLSVERQFEDIRLFCVAAEKKISASLQSINPSTHVASTIVQSGLNQLTSNNANNANSPLGCTTSSGANISPSELYPRPQENLVDSSNSVATKVRASNESLYSIHQPSHDSKLSHQSRDVLPNDIRRFKRLPIVGFLKFLTKHNNKLKQDSLLSTALLYCSQMQTQLTELFFNYEQTIDLHCLKPIQHMLEVDVPNVLKLKKSFIKSHYDLESAKAKFSCASQKHLQYQSQNSLFSSSTYSVIQSSSQLSNINKLEQLKKELDEASTRFEQAKDSYAIEMYAFVCREAGLANLFMKFYQFQADYYQQVNSIIVNSLPSFTKTLANTPRKMVFGTSLEEHLRCIGRPLALVLELSVHLLFSYGLNEEGLFRVPGSSMKVKKLRNAINAWFVTLANQNELENNQKALTDSDQGVNEVVKDSSIIAIYNLMKDILGQHSSTNLDLSTESSSSYNLSHAESKSNSNASSNDATLSSLKSSPTSTSKREARLTFEVNSIAGLLKLYLRELPEPLFTHKLYNSLVEATVNYLSNREQQSLNPLKEVIERLPQANFDNLRHLMRFLHVIASNHETNKMNASNLAIAMAPSLIWGLPIDLPQQQQLAGYSDSSSSAKPPKQPEEEQTLNTQMQGVGMSASLHAVVIENLIKHAELLFEGPVDFAISNLSEETSDSPNDRTLKPRTISSHHSTQTSNVAERWIPKSTSPTVLSTTSSSSFSSNSNSSSRSMSSQTQSHKDGSIDGLMDECSLRDDNSSNASSRAALNKQLKSSIPAVLHKRKNSPPPIPPMPATRSHQRQASDSVAQGVNLRPSSMQAHAAANILSLSSRQEPSRKDSPSLMSASTEATAWTSDLKSDVTKGVPMRCTNTIIDPTKTCSTNSCMNRNVNSNATRPSVPPPNRPPAPSQGGRGQVSHKSRAGHDMNGSNGATGLPSSRDLVDSSKASLSSSGKFEEICTTELDSGGKISPVVSLASLPLEAGSGSCISTSSSFDHDEEDDIDCVLENSWALCSVNGGDHLAELQVISIGDEIEITSSNESAGASGNAVNKTASTGTPNGSANVGVVAAPRRSNQQASLALKDQQMPAPTKPPRGTSPKATSKLVGQKES